MTSRSAVELHDRRMMDLALRAAVRGRPSPNPHVGAAVVRDAEVIAIGHHARAGDAHAEIAALRAAGSLARGATLYVTMAPCNHFGRTPPCTDAIIEAGIARVVVGCADPAPHVPGAAEKLRAAGVEVHVGVHEERATRLIADFAHHITCGRPFVTLKAAVTLDGRLATRTGDSRWITGDRARREAHRLRDRHDAVLVGIGTVAADDPELTVRHVAGVDPLRVVLDTELRTPPAARAVTGRALRRTLVLHAPDADPSRREPLERAGAELVVVPRAASGGLDLFAVLDAIGNRDVVRLLVEGGSRVHGAMLELGLVDRAAIFVAPVVVGDTGKPLAATAGPERIADAWRLSHVRIRRLGDDVLVTGDVLKGAR